MKLQKMKLNEVKDKINNSKFKIESERDIENAKQLKISNGAIINCYDNGSIIVQGKNTKEIESILISKEEKCRKIFIVYGHNEELKDELENLLRKMKFEPIILKNVASKGRTIIEKLEECSSEVGYAFVLATPDDEGKAKTEKDYKSRVRQNVILELGMFLAKLGRERVAILQKEEEDFEKPSDIDGLIYIPFKNKIKEVLIDIIKELREQGYEADIKEV